MHRSYLLVASFLCVSLLFANRVESTTLPERPTPKAKSTASPPPYLEYVVYQGAVITDPILPPVLSNGQGDYTVIFDRYGICPLVNQNKVDEVWIWAGNGDGVTKGNLWEWNTSGPRWTSGSFWQVDIPNCGKVVTVMTFNYLREVDVALESYNHRLEGFFMNYFPCDFSTATWPWFGNGYWLSRCSGRLSNQYGFVARPFIENNQVGNCGDAHHPPNILDDQEYVFNNQAYANTNCMDWSLNGTSQTASINCIVNLLI